MSRPRQGDLFGGSAPPEPVAERAPAAPAPAVPPPATVAVAPPPPPELRPPTAPAPPAAAPKTPAWRRVEPAAAQRVLTVSQLTGQVKDLLEPHFGRVLVRGEVSNFRGANARGHLYFALKDERASIDVKLWATQAQKLKFKLKDGLSLIVEGSLDVFPPQGRYSLIATRLEPEGVGAQALAFEQLKQKLVAEGLIGPNRSRAPRPVPFLPRRIGVVTSVTGAALRDFLHVLHRRHPRLSVLVADARMQGDGAVLEIRRALRWLSRAQVDVIVVTRGGGSVEDLWTFNEEPVVRAVWECPVPVVSAVGHEIDVTLCDLVADVRAPDAQRRGRAAGPSALRTGGRPRCHPGPAAARGGEGDLAGAARAARLARRGLGEPRRALSGQQAGAVHARRSPGGRAAQGSPRGARHPAAASAQRLQRARPQAQLKLRRDTLGALRAALQAQLQRRVRAARERLGRLSVALERDSPRPMIRHGRQGLAQLEQRLASAVSTRWRTERAGLDALRAQLHQLSPLAVLGRGYAIAQDAEGRVIRRATDVAVGDQLRLRLGGDDELEAQVLARKPIEG